MSARPPGRRTESLFDNRYRYDHIYPRGRSGETLRAYDTLQGDRPVVVKRPAPQDAPPMRAGQEVSIRNERHALERLSGHPVLIELCGGGSFRVGGHTHEYIVLELAEGAIVEESVLELAKDSRLLPELESLVIVDRLLDLLAFAHEKNVIYNDVDAKHLFWDRASYQLKVIDWGNAVFADEPGAPASASRARDIFQVGELLYFIFTGGMRLATESDDGGETFFVNFGDHAERIPARLQTILTRAVHPDPKRRFGSIGELRQALAEYRQPLERVRDEIVARVRKRVRPTASQEELEQLAAELEDAVAMDPGDPDTRALAAEIATYRQQIMVQADLDAIRIYLESGNWPRALSLLDDLLPEADPESADLIRFLIATAAICERLRISPPPAGFLAALDTLFAGDTALAADTLLTTPESRPIARDAQWLIAEQLSTITGLMLLRPHLVRLKTDLSAARGGERPLNALRAAAAQLDVAPGGGVSGVRALYEEVDRSLEHLGSELERVSISWVDTDQASALASVARAREAACAIVEQLDVVSQTAVSDPMRAGEQLRGAAAIDPLSPHFDAVNEYLDEVHQALNALAQFKPRPDGANLAEWFRDVDEFLAPYLADLSDPRLRTAAGSIRQAAEGWGLAESYLALGRRQPSIDVLRATADQIRPVNEHLAAWLGMVANRVPDATFVERHSVNARLADLLIDGWKAWDRGDATHALELAHKARDAAQTDGERLSADRLFRLSELLGRWLAEGKQDVELTARAEKEALALLLTDEEQERQTFTEQIPTTALFLRTMGRGLVAYLHQSSSAGWRALYLHFVLRAALALLSDDLEDADFWRSAAAKTFDDAPTHPAYQLVDRALTGRRLLETAEASLNAISGPADLDRARRALNAPLAAELLGGAEQSVQMAMQAVRDWSDGDFYAARQNLDVALDDIQRARASTDLRIDSYVAWLSRLRDTANMLQAIKLDIEQAAARPTDRPDPALVEAHRQIIDLTLSTLGPDYAHQIRQWHDTLQSVQETYIATRLNRREKLAAFSRHFGSLFITKHPAYPLYRHWESVIEQLPPDEPEKPAPPPHAIRAAPPAAREDGEELTFLLDDAEPAALAEPVGEASTHERGDLPWNWIIGGAAIVLAAIVAVAVIRARSNDDRGGGLVRSGSGFNRQATATHLAPAPTQAQAAALPPDLSDTPDAPEPALTEAPSATPDLPPTEPPLTPTLFVTSTLAPSRAVAASGPLREEPPNTDVLRALGELPPGDLPWESDSFAPTGEGWRLAAGATNDAEAMITLDPALLGRLFGPGVASTLTSARAVMRLVEYNPGEMAAGNVTLGLGALNTGGQSAIGKVQFQEPEFVGLGMAQNGVFRARAEAPLSGPEFELSLRRVNANTLGFYLGDQLLGDSVVVFPEGAPITLALTASGRGTVVEVSAFEVEFSPRSELP
ncbi:MAG TPA: hypothetical protein PKD46_00695 [Aggregatilineaceae bacterium]|nr:hypothetical protein [Aggregatilineaceae bacterium]